MASARDFWARIVGSLYFIPLFLGVIAGFPYAVFTGGIAIIWLAYEAAWMLTGKQHSLRMALVWLLLVLPFFLAFAPLSSAAIALLWLSLHRELQDQRTADNLCIDTSKQNPTTVG